MSDTFWHRAGRIGTVFVIVGSLLIGFVAYELLLTGVGQQFAQHALQQSVDKALPTSLGPVATKGSPLPSGPAVPGPTLKAAGSGAWVGVIQIPSIKLRQVVVEGVDARALSNGPGHYPGTASLGAEGNTGIAGHRTTYGGPFRRLNELHVGDPIVISTSHGSYLYRVTDLQRVSPNDVSVLAPTSVPTLTLTTCDPPLFATKRLVVTATLRASEPFVTTPVTPTSGPAQYSGAPAQRDYWSAVLWGTLLALWLGLGLRWRERTAATVQVSQLVGVGTFILVLVWYHQLAFLLPSSL